MRGIRLRHLTFTGSAIDPATIKFQDGLNVIYGASNTGKSFVSKAILFMLAASKELPETEEIVPYDAVWLGLNLPDNRDVTLYRAVRGGHFKLHEGLVSSAGPDDGVPLRQGHDSNRTDTVSHILLEAMGLVGKKIVRDGNGSKDNLTIFRLCPYAVVSEGDIMHERSPVFSSGVPAERVFEQNLFKLLLTGTDDSAAVTVPKSSDRKAAKAAKIELVEEMIAQLDAELGEDAPDEKQIEEQLERLDRSSGDLFGRLQTSQRQLDELATERRSAFDRHRQTVQRADELDLMLRRFAKLQAVYSSDLERLRSIEEGGYVLVAIAGRDCPVCGAPPDAQRHNHAADEIDMAYKAAAAEARKIALEQNELSQTMSSLEAEVYGLRGSLSPFINQIEQLDQQIAQARPLEASLRTNYEAYASKRNEIAKILEFYQRRARLVARKAEIEAEPTRREGDALPVGLDTTTAYKFGETVKSVLKSWHFPDAEKAQFDLVTNDITIGGKRRAANGKGVRAILHAAFNVALIVYCIENDLPHPGFLVLDTPLLTYREPMTSRYGELAEDEAELKQTSVAEHFYKHLESLKENVQFLVLENVDPPQSIRPLATIETFTHLDGNGRFGLLARRS